jgi:extracellular elastinolytic metalloproteinase
MFTFDISIKIYIFMNPTYKWLFGILFLSSSLLFAQENAKPNDEKIRSVLLQNASTSTLSTQDLAYKITSYHSSKKSKVQHIYLRQTYNGLEIVGTESSIHLNEKGDVIFNQINFLNSLSKRTDPTISGPILDEYQAVLSAANHLKFTSNGALTIQTKGNSKEKKTIFNKGSFSKDDIAVQLTYINQNDKILLVWELTLHSIINSNDWYTVYVNASNGEIVHKINLVLSCHFDSNPNHDHSEHVHLPQEQFGTTKAQLQNSIDNLVLTGTYQVFPMPLESPYYGNHQNVSANDVVNLNASPFGWHDTNGVDGPEYLTTRGNNVNAFDAGDNNGFQPNGGQNLNFTGYPFDQNYTNQNQYESAALTNLFYWNNIIHDVFYEYGFDEAAGNFQANNYGKGGVGNDPVSALSQIGENCNATFGTPTDGNSPTMSMYICNNKDGNFDNMVVTHEYGHGISNRLTGGQSVSCLQNQEQMGEGWSDYFGLMLTMTASDTATKPRAVGTYLFGQGINGSGIRTYKYTTDMAVNPHTYNSIKTESVPHGVGSVWTAMLWDMTWLLIEEYGFDPDIYNGTGGNNIALSLVVEGLKLQPCSPGFVDGRDAILLADEILYNGANSCLIWEAFARRGLGLSATQGSSNNRSDGVQAFDSPSSTIQFSAPDEVCMDNSILMNLSGGTPFGGTYSGPGVTDNGNGTYNFNPEIAGVGTHTITYSLPTTICFAASTLSDQVIVIPGLDIECPDDIVVEVGEDECSTVVNYTAPTVNPTCNLTNIENFDDLILPNLPEGWTNTVHSGSDHWLTRDFESTSSPNSAYGYSAPLVGSASLTTKSYQIDSNSASLSFQIYHRLEQSYDGVLLEYSINNGATWTDIKNGGTFISHPYTHTISSSFSSPISGREAWSGNSGGFKEVKLVLNSSLNGQNVKFRWVIGSDSSVSYEGVYIDDFQITGVYQAPPTLTQTAGLPSGSVFPIGTTTNTFEVYYHPNNVKTCSFDVMVEDNLDPIINCPTNQTIEIPHTETYVLPDYWAEELVTATDNCEIFTHTQSPLAGTELAPGTHTIEFSAIDSSGNESTCSFVLTIESEKQEAVITAEETQTFVFDGTVKNVIATLNHSETSLVYTPQQGYTNIGSYSITVSAAETEHYLAASKNVNLVIEEAIINGVSFENGTFTYNGNPHSIFVSGLPSDATVTYTNNGQINAGSYTVTALVTKPNYANLQLSATLTINKAQAIITANNTQTHVFDGTMKNAIGTLNHAETSLVYTPQQGYINVGNYPITISAAETPNYLAATKSINLIIEEATFSGITFENGTFTYDGTQHSIFVSGLPSDATVTYTNNGQINAGSYTVTALVTKPNYANLQLNATLTINKAQAIITANNTQTHVFDGTMKNAIGTLNHAETSLVYTPQQGYINVGNYPITISAAETPNYLAASKSINLIIEEATFSGITFENGTFTYDGTQHSIFVSGAPSGANVSYTNNGQINAGSYTVTALITMANYADLQLTATLTISKAQAIITANNTQTHVFDGTMKNAIGTLNHTETSLVYTPQQGYINVGNYPITISAAETPNYLAATKSINLIIEEATFSGITFENGTFTYNGTQHSIFVSGAPSGANVSYTNNGQINAGSYTVTALITMANYADLELTATLTINKAQAIITAEDVQEHLYDGTLKNVVASLNHSETVLQYIPQQGYTEVGIYEITVQAPESQNYLGASKNVSLRIEEVLATIEHSQDFNVTIVPNPAKTSQVIKIFVGYPQEELNKMTIRIFTFTGELVKEVRSNKSVTEIRLPESMGSNSYIIQCDTGKHIKNVKLLVK